MTMRSINVQQALLGDSFVRGEFHHNSSDCPELRAGKGQGNTGEGRSQRGLRCLDNICHSSIGWKIAGSENSEGQPGVL